jgi:LPPG:FO 2-phospho-L-lactate transferase
LGVARLYQSWVDGFVLDNLDAALAPQIEALGMKTTVCETLMSKPGVDSHLAKAALTLAASLRNSTDDGRPSLEPSA